MIKYIDLESSLQSSPLTSAESLVVRKLIGSLICYHYTTIYYSAVASNLLRLAISRAILSDQPELVL